jgi:hypothetical protein
MKGTLTKTEQGWMVGTVCYADIWSQYIPLHPENVKQVLDSMDGMYVDFEIFHLSTDPLGRDVKPYAKLINQFSDVGNMVEISDEEIEKVSATLDYDHISEIVMWEKGARWYREQFKQIQNGNQ